MRFYRAWKHTDLILRHVTSLRKAVNCTLRETFLSLLCCSQVRVYIYIYTQTDTSLLIITAMLLVRPKAAEPEVCAKRRFVSQTHTLRRVCNVEDSNAAAWSGFTHSWHVRHASSANISFTHTHKQSPSAGSSCTHVECQ